MNAFRVYSKEPVTIQVKPVMVCSSAGPDFIVFAVQRVSTGIRLEAVDTTTTGTRYWCFKEVAGANPAIPATPAASDKQQRISCM